MLRISKYLFFVLLLTSYTNSYAEVVESGVSFTDSTTVADTPLVLNGTGTRKATIFKVKVYAAGLYTATKSNSAEEILLMKTPSYLRMVFVRDVGREKFVDGFIEGIEENNEATPELMNTLEKFNRNMRDVKDGELAELTFIPGDRVIAKIGLGDTFEVVDEVFPTALLRVWLGKSPPNKSLKEGLLGK